METLNSLKKDNMNPAITENKRLSFKKIWLRLGKISKNNIIDGFLSEGYAISTLYSDKDGRTVVNDERRYLYEKLFIAEGVKKADIWD